MNSYDVFIAALTGRSARPGSPVEVIEFAEKVETIFLKGREVRNCRECVYFSDMGEHSTSDCQLTYDRVLDMTINHAPGCPFFRPLNDESRAAAEEF